MEIPGITDLVDTVLKATPTNWGGSSAPAPQQTQVAGAPNNARNNPGNVEDGPFAKSQPGYVGPDPANPRFARFNSPDAGGRAQIELLRSSPNYKGKSVADIIQTYSPLGDNSESSVRNYIGYVASRIGLDPTKPVPPDRVAQLAGAMREFETGKKVNSNFSPYAGTLRAPKMANSGGGNGVTPRGNYERWLQDSLPPEVAVSQGQGLPPGAAEVIFGSSQQIQDRQKGVENALGDMGKRIDVLDAATQAAHTQELTSKAAQVEDSRRINNEVVTATDQLKRTAQPVIEARERIADQLDKLATMNPLERGIKSIFDLNYDQKYLSGQLARFDETLKARMYDYDYINSLQNVALQALDRRYGIDTALTDLNVKQSTEDLALVNQRLGLASSMLSSTRESLQTQSQLIVAQNQAREDVLSRIDTPTTIQLMTQAQQNGGEIDFNGVKFSYTELRNHAEAGQQQDRQIRSYQLALAQGEMNLAQGIASDITKSLTRPQLEQAAANNGVWNGIQLDQMEITQGLAGFRAQAEGQAQDILNKMPETLVNQTTTSTINSMIGLYHRVKALQGPVDLRGSSMALGNVAQIAHDIDAAQRNNAPPEVIQALMAKLAKASQDYQTFVGQSIERSVGGDKRAAGYVQSFVYGTQLTPGTAAEALTYFAIKGALPDGLAVSPEARQIFTRAQQIVGEVQKQDPKAPMDRIMREVQQKVTEYAASIIATPRLNDTIRSLPTLARQAGHGFGKISDDWWRRTYADADTAATADLAQTLKTSPENVSRMMSTMKPIDSTPASQDLFKRFMQSAGQYNSLEQGYIFKKLDSVSPVQPGTSNSELMEDFLYSPQFARQVNQRVQAIEGNSFGDYIVGPLAQGSTQMAVVNYANSFRDQASRERVSGQTAAQQANRVWGSNGGLRVMTVLRSIPQIGPAGADKLRPFVQQVTQNLNLPMVALGSPHSASVAVAGEDISKAAEIQVLDALNRTKFNDPAMETLRKAALQHWGEYSQYGDTIMQSYHAESKR